ncbi:MAG: hypothetical protein RI996_218 [Candidatus Parcubacteria bacterium]
MANGSSSVGSQKARDTLILWIVAAMFVVACIWGLKIWQEIENNAVPRSGTYKATYLNLQKKVTSLVEVTFEKKGFETQVSYPNQEGGVKTLHFSCHTGDGTNYRCKITWGNGLYMDAYFTRLGEGSNTVLTGKVPSDQGGMEDFRFEKIPF